MDTPVEEIMDRISERLVMLKASRWLPVLHRWLSQYRGLYDVISGDSESPESQIAALLEQMSVPVDDGVLAARLARLDFLTWRARIGNQPWRPLKAPFLSIWSKRVSNEAATEAPEVAVSVWQSDREYPEPAETEKWLLACLREIAPCPTR